MKKDDNDKFFLIFMIDILSYRNLSIKTFHQNKYTKKNYKNKFKDSTYIK